jgi:hypothetical protein
LTLKLVTCLGVDKGTEEEKFLDISGITGQLKKEANFI